MKAWWGLIGVLSLTSCDRVDPEWKGSVYPDRNNPKVEWKLGSFKSFQGCQSAAQNIINWLPDRSNAEYECGYKCKTSEFLDGQDVCIDLIRSRGA